MTRDGLTARSMAVEGRGAGPYDRAVELKSAPEPNHVNPRLAAAHPRWIRNVNDYDRRERCEFQVTRFG